MPDGQAGGDRIEAAVRAVLGSLSGDMTATEAALLGELEALGREVARAKSEIAALRVEDINASHISTATDELDAVVSHTATATNEILDCCEVLEGLQARLAGEDAEALGGAVTRIYEACSFQDITGQRIGKVVSALKSIEKRVAAVTHSFGRSEGEASPEIEEVPMARTEGEALANGPQLPGWLPPRPRSTGCWRVSTDALGTAACPAPARAGGLGAGGGRGPGGQPSGPRAAGL